jgi:NADH dehydrogenase (ubiquinone) 1 alpha subcomplex subunit 13
MFEQTKVHLQRITDVGPKTDGQPRIIQDMPPPGGYPPVRIRKSLMTKFWSPYTMTIGMVAIMTYGWVKFSKYSKLKKALNEEQKVLEAAITPFLMAEYDLK